MAATMIVFVTMSQGTYAHSNGAFAIKKHVDMPIPTGNSTDAEGPT
jgi:hypothetical protein